MLQLASLGVAAFLAIGIGADANTSEADRSTGCIRRFTIGHVPGRVDNVWMVQCIPNRTAITRD